MNPKAALLVTLALLTSAATLADQVGCVTTEWKLIGANHKVCVESFNDPKVPGVTCHVSQARTGGVSGSLGLAQDPSQFSLACRQTGPITLPEKLPKEATVFAEDTSILFKETRVVRLWDETNRTLVYLAISRKLINGAPANSISTVPVMPWGARGGKESGERRVRPRLNRIRHGASGRPLPPRSGRRESPRRR